MHRLLRLTRRRRSNSSPASLRLRLRVKQPQDARSGLTLFELVVALFVLTTAMVAIVQLLAVAASQRRTIEQRRVALRETANQAERISLLPWNEMQTAELATWDLSEESRKTLPQATTAMEIHEESEPVKSRRIRLMIRSPNTVGQSIDLADLTVWKFAPGGEP